MESNKSCVEKDVAEQKIAEKKAGETKQVKLLAEKQMKLVLC